MIGLPDPRLLLGAAVAVALTAGGAYIKGRWDGAAMADAAYQKAAYEASERARETEAQAAAITVDVGQQHAAALAEIHIVKQIVTREVPRYVTVKADAACTVPVGFVGLHDAAAGGRVPDVPDAASSPDGPSGIALSAVAGVVTGNYGACHETAARLTALQEWVRRQGELTAMGRR